MVDQNTYYDSKGRMHPPVACSWCFKRPVLRCTFCHRWLCESHAKDHAHPGKSRKEKEGKSTRKAGVRTHG